MTMNKKEFKAWLKECDKDHKERMKDIKQYEKNMEKTELEYKINSYDLEQANGTSFDEEDQKEQRRRLWMLSIIKNKEDDAFLKKHGLIHISKLRQIPEIKIPVDIIARAHGDLARVWKDKKKGINIRDI